MSDRATETPSTEELVAVVEAILYAAGEPVQAKVISRSLRGVTADDVRQAMKQLDERFENEGAGLRVEHVAGGAQISTRPELGAWVRRFFREQNRTRLSPAALEILAIVAYRQPVTGPEIMAIRGKDSSGPLKNLLEKKLVRMMGRKKVIGNPILYGTSKDFLVHFGLNTLGDLPEMEEFEEVVGLLEERQAAAFAEEDSAETEGTEVETSAAGSTETAGSSEPAGETVEAAAEADAEPAPEGESAQEDPAIPTDRELMELPQAGPDH